MIIDDAQPVRPYATAPRRTAAREPGPWRGLAVFVVGRAVAHLLDEAVAGIARGLEILDVVVLDESQRARARAVLPGLGRMRPAGALAVEPYAFVVACDVGSPAPAGDRAVEARVAAVLHHTEQRLVRRFQPRSRVGLVDVLAGPERALVLLDTLDDPSVRERLEPRAAELTRVCAVPFPVLRMLGGTSPGFRARVALVDHPRFGPVVCKVFRPGSAEAFDRELRARLDLGDLPEVPALLEHGPNWLLTPFYRDSGRHLVRRLPGELAQLRPSVVRTLLRFCHDLHDRGRFVLDLSPHNLLWDPRAGLKVLDLEFVFDYPDPAPSWDDCWSLRGVPGDFRAATEGVPELMFTRGVGNSVFHPAVSGLRRRELLGAGSRWESARRTATQLAWFGALGTVGRLHPALRGHR
ncbi:hypothetical protein WIS52_28870 [Pseudonocardia nematodicida]|uniref:Uncharacterized protein n=1 Tax=Pseudonocardia nematodicida TaxID=1206997 RepID=A0ABV1KJF7_9PSEU